MLLLSLYKKGGSIKEQMRCGEVRKSTRKGKKIMQKVCIDGKEKLIHAGAAGYSDYTKHRDPERRFRFHKRHRCDKAEYGTPRWLACNKLWQQGGLFSYYERPPINDKHSKAATILTGLMTNLVSPELNPYLAGGTESSIGYIIQRFGYDQDAFMQMLQDTELDIEDRSFIIKLSEVLRSMGKFRKGGKVKKDLLSAAALVKDFLAESSVEGEFFRHKKPQLFLLYLAERTGYHPSDIMRIIYQLWNKSHSFLADFVKALEGIEPSKHVFDFYKKPSVDDKNAKAARILLGFDGRQSFALEYFKEHFGYDPIRLMEVIDALEPSFEDPLLLEKVASILRRIPPYGKGYEDSFAIKVNVRPFEKPRMIITRYSNERLSAIPNKRIVNHLQSSLKEKEREAIRIKKLLLHCSEEEALSLEELLNELRRERDKMMHQLYCLAKPFIANEY